MEFAGHGVEVVLDDGEAHWADVEVGAFGQPASQQADASMMLLFLSNRLLGEPLLVLGGEVVVVV